MELKINSKKLRPGIDFIVQQASKGIKAKTSLTTKDSANFIDTENKITLTLQDKLTWSVAQKVNDYTQVFIKKSAINTKPKSLDINIQNAFIPDFSAANICGVVKGTRTVSYTHLDVYKRQG